MTTLTAMADMLYDAINIGDVDTVMDLLKKGANVNVLPSCGRTALGRAAQLGHLAIVCLLLDAEKFYTTPEEEDVDTEAMFSCAKTSTGSVAQASSTSTCASLITATSPEPWSSPVTLTSVPVASTSSLRPSLGSSLRSPQPHKCCSPSIDSETCTCSDELWGLDLSDTNQHSDWEAGRCNRDLPSNNNEEGSETEKEGAYSVPVCSHTSSQYAPSNIGYYVYEYREEDEDTGDSSGPILSSTEDSDSALIAEKRHHHHLHRHSSSILLQRTLGRGRANIVSSDSEFETENRRHRRHARHNHRSHRHERDNGRHKALVNSHRSSPWLAQLHSEYLSLGLTSPWSLSRNCDINQQDAYGRSALHYATEQGHTYIVHMLIKSGVRIDTPDAEHMTALHLAAQRGLAEVITLLLEGGAKVNTKMNDKSSPLHIAASRGYTDIVETLLDRGAKIDSLDSSDRTALIVAVSRSNYKVVQLLLKRGAKVNIEEIHGYTPLCEAVWHKDIKLVQMLLAAGAKVTQSHYLLHYAVLHRHYQLAELLLGARCIVNLRDDNGDTPLIIAARTCQPSIIKLLLKHGANTNYPNGLTGTTPLHEAVEGTRDALFADFGVVFLLLRIHGARLDVETVTAGDTPLYRALLLEKNKAAALLIRQGCNVNHRTPAGTLDYLHMTALRSNAPLATLLVLAGFKLWHAEWLVGIFTPGTLLSRLAAVRSQPLTLADLCRIHIRCRLGERVQVTLQASSLPPRVVRFLMLEDVAEVDL
ncbi:ankyrin repeat, PH and SEC7 domain containing protein secG isoform X1 [Procambarus clarkii]|uniref:ankyrin repeat, PH and SEC7 domain containing protein secG isoform X1 n=1 Tax=Procambarus clarkii TaxID=6728 RepID=UPI001E678A69|nr:ankyrin-3-like isoform X2 [Procambarus clarkii]